MKKLIVGKNVKLRALETEDLPKLKELRNRKEVRIHVREYRILGMINQKEWFNSLFKENPPKAIMFAVLNMKNSLIGICGLTYIDWKNRNAEISILLSLKNWQKRKESKDTISLLIKYGFGELNLHRLWVEVWKKLKKFLTKIRRYFVIAFQCPLDIKKINWKIAVKFDGFSDHTLGITAPIIFTILKNKGGARKILIEKHVKMKN